MIAFLTYGMFSLLCWCLTAYHLIMYYQTKAGKWKYEAWISGLSGFIPAWNIFYGIKVVAIPFMEAMKSGKWDYFK